MMQEKVSIGIFDDHAFFIKGLTDFLENYKNEMQVLFTATKVDELHAQLNKRLPDVLIVDVLSPEVTGLELYIDILKKHEDLKILAYTSLRSDILIESLLEIGVKGYVNKNQTPSELVEAIKDINYGLVSVPDIYQDLVPKEQKTVNKIFTNREFEIIQLISKGQTSDSISKQLGVSLRTIENLKVTLYKKLKVSSAAELILAASRMGYIN